MKDKVDFYIEFYERLAEQGFQAYIAYDQNEHIADICVNGGNIAHLTKSDTIEANPYAEGADAGTLERLREIAKSAALSCGVCTELPYDETKHKRRPDGSYQLAEHDNTVLSCARHPILGYEFSVFRVGQPAIPQKFYDRDDAMRGFVIASGLMDGRQFFSERDLTAIHNSLFRLLMMPGNSLDREAVWDIEGVIGKVEAVMPELAVAVSPAAFTNQYENGLSEGANSEADYDDVWELER